MEVKSKAPAQLLDVSLLRDDGPQDAGEGSNQMLLMPRKRKEKKSGSLGNQNEEAQKDTKKGSNRKQRKLKQLLKKHKERDVRAALHEELQKYDMRTVLEQQEGGVAAGTDAAAKAAGAAGDIAAAEATAAAADSEKTQLAKTMLLLGRGSLLTGVKGRRLQKKARKALMLQQEVQRRQQQLQQQRQLTQQQQKQQKEAPKQSSDGTGETKIKQEDREKRQEKQQHKEVSSAHSEAKERGGESSQGPVEQQQQQEKKQQQQQQKTGIGAEQLVDGGLSNELENDTASTTASSSSSSSSGQSAERMAASLQTKRAAAAKAAAGAACRGNRNRLPRISYSPEAAAACLRRSPEFEQSRAALPAAEAEGRVLSFLLQQEHPLMQEAEECSSSSDEEARAAQTGSPAAAGGASRKRKRKKMLDLAGRRHADILCISGATGSGKSTQIPQFVFESGICYPQMHFSKKCEAALQLLEEQASAADSAVAPASAANAAAAVVAGSENEGVAEDAPVSAATAAAAAKPGSLSVEATKEGIVVKRQMSICITQPRRVAAVSLARRVAEEMGSPELVGYQVRHDRHNVGPHCRLKFATDGILLREIQDDFLLRKYCCIIVDEAHERSINVDLLLGLVSRVVVMRRERFERGKDTLPPLKVLVMSATLKATDFTENSHLFTPPPALLHLESRTFEVRVHFSKKTPDHYVDAAVKKALQIHTRLPAGSVLVFLTGRAEVLEAVRQLQEWQKRRYKRFQASAAFTAAAATEGDGEDDSGVVAPESDFLLSDQSEDEPLPLEEEKSPDYDSEVSVHSDDSFSSRSSQRRRPKLKLPNHLLQLSLASDAEESDGPHSEIKEAEEEVLRAVLSTPHLSSSANETQVAPCETMSPHGDSSSKSHGASNVLQATRTEGTVSKEGKGKRRKVSEPSKYPEEAINVSLAVPETPAKSPRPPQGAAEAGIETFDSPDTSKRRVRKTLSAGGWLGAGVQVRKKPADNEKSQDGSTSGALPGKEESVQEPPTSSQEETVIVPRLTAIPLYATLPGELQRLAFEPPSPDERRIIVATNVAETSLTLPNVRYVVDSGREKRRVFATGSECFSYFTVTLTSQAAAQQRAGRAGRVGAGVCYRLYSSAVYEHEMERYPPPQIHTVPLDHLLLFMAALGIPRPSAFPFPSPPAAAALESARRRLVALGALQPKGSEQKQKHHQKSMREPEVCCTALGRRMSELPIPPRFAKILLLACSRHKEHGPEFVAVACYLVAALSVGELLPSLPPQSRIGDIGEGDAAGNRMRPPRRPWEEQDSDIDAYVWLCGAYSHARSPVGFCKSYGLDPSRFAEVGALAAQLAQLMRVLLQRARQGQESLEAAEPQQEAPADDLQALKAPLRLAVPTAEAKRCLQQCVVQGLIDHVAVWQDPPRLPPDATPEQRAANRGGYRCAELKGQLALVHSASNILHVSPRPKLLVYNQLIHEGRAMLQICHPLQDTELSTSDSPLIHHTFLQLPAPAYDSRRDAVMGWSRPVYSPLQLPLQAVERPLLRTKSGQNVAISPQEQQQQLYECFASALIAGRVMPRLKRFASALCVTPEGMLAGSRSGTFAVRAFVTELAKKDIASRAELVKLWKAEPKYLLGEYIALLRSYNYETLQDVRDMWPPI